MSYRRDYENYDAAVANGPVKQRFTSVLERINTCAKALGGAASDIDFDISNFIGQAALLDYDVTVNDDRVILLRAGTFRVFWKSTIERQGGGPNPALMEGRLEVGGLPVAGSQSESSHTLQTFGVQSMSNDSIVILAVGADLRLVTQRIAGTGPPRLIAFGGKLVIERLF